VRESALAEIARGLQLGSALQLGPGELKTGGHRRDRSSPTRWKPVVDATTSIPASNAVGRSCLPWFEASLAALAVGKVEKDPKTRLQEWLQARQLERPEYVLVETRGDDHERLFVVRCRLAEPLASAEGQGSSMRAAEQAAAASVLAQVEAA
jgi:ribonuclease-3